MLTRKLFAQYANIVMNVMSDIHNDERMPNVFNANFDSSDMDARWELWKGISKALNEEADRVSHTWERLPTLAERMAEIRAKRDAA